jgi:hypothetical protein
LVDVLARRTVRTSWGSRGNLGMAYFVGLDVSLEMTSICIAEAGETVSW